MGTIKCGFWTSRFLISADEFDLWADEILKQGFEFIVKNMPEDVKGQYRAFYEKRMSPSEDHKMIPLVCYGIKKEGVDTSYHLISKEWSFYPEGKGVVRTKIFVEISSPRQYAVTHPDGLHFTYEDILEVEPEAKIYFDQLTKPIKAMTKPLYDMGKPVYSIRISKAAYKDLENSAFIKETGAGLTSKW